MGDTLEKVCENTILNRKCNYKKWLRDQNYEHMQGKEHQLKGKLFLEVILHVY